MKRIISQSGITWSLMGTENREIRKLFFLRLNKYSDSQLWIALPCTTLYLILVPDHSSIDYQSYPTTTRSFVQPLMSSLVQSWCRRSGFRRYCRTCGTRNWGSDELLEGNLRWVCELFVRFWWDRTLQCTCSDLIDERETPWNERSRNRVLVEFSDNLQIPYNLTGTWQKAQNLTDNRQISEISTDR